MFNFARHRRFLKEMDKLASFVIKGVLTVYKLISTGLKIKKFPEK